MSDNITKSKFKQFQPIEGMEVIGLTLIGMAHNLEERRTRPIMEKYGLDLSTLDPEGWYPQSLISEVAQAIHKQSSSDALIATGKALAQRIPAEQIPDIEAFLLDWKERQKQDLRNAPENWGLLAEKKGENHYHLINNTTFSNESLFGFLWQLFANYSTANKIKFVVKPIYGFGTDMGATFEAKWGDTV